MSGELSKFYIKYLHPKILLKSFINNPHLFLYSHLQVISCNKNICTLQITDTTGSHQFPAMQRLNISKGHAFILVYAVTSSQSLEELRPIFEVIKEVKAGEDLEGIPIMLVGNKCDEMEAREVQTSGGEAQAKKWGCGFMETSAKTNCNVKELFQELLNMEKRRNVSLNMDTSKKRSQLRKEKLKGKCSLMQTLRFARPNYLYDAQTYLTITFLLGKSKQLSYFNYHADLPNYLDLQQIVIFDLNMKFDLIFEKCSNCLFGIAYTSLLDDEQPFYLLSPLVRHVGFKRPSNTECTRKRITRGVGGFDTLSKFIYQNYTKHLQRNDIVHSFLFTWPLGWPVKDKLYKFL